MLLGADSAIAVDIVDNSVRTALENAEMNHISSDVYHAYCGDICSDTALREKIGTGYDLIYANIVADVLIAMSGLFGTFLKPDGHLIVSGIIIERADEVLNELEAHGFEKVIVKEKEGGPRPSPGEKKKHTPPVSPRHIIYKTFIRNILRRFQKFAGLLHQVHSC